MDEVIAIADFLDEVKSKIADIFNKRAIRKAVLNDKLTELRS